MLTHHDVTVKDAGEIFEQCKDLPVKFWGFKNVGLPKDEMKKVAGAMKAAGKTTFLEVVTYDEASCLDGAQTAIDAEICIAGSINSYARIDTMFDIGPWTFTMGSALFEKKFVADGSFRDNLKAVADYMASK